MRFIKHGTDLVQSEASLIEKDCCTSNVSATHTSHFTSCLPSRNNIFQQLLTLLLSKGSSCLL